MQRLRVSLSQRRLLALSGIGIVLLFGVVGIVTVSRVTEQMTRDANDRLDRHTLDQATALEELMASASRDIRLARRNDIFETALRNSRDQLQPADRVKVEEAIRYLGERYDVDEICVIRSDGLETAMSASTTRLSSRRSSSRTTRSTRRTRTSRPIRSDGSSASRRRSSSMRAAPPASSISRSRSSASSTRSTRARSAVLRTASCSTAAAC
jgi:hypothetical protein